MAAVVGSAMPMIGRFIRRDQSGQQPSSTTLVDATGLVVYVFLGRAVPTLWA